jgi:prephenate dehydrogenase
MKLQIIGDGAFGTFLTELLDPVFDLDKSADSVILAVPISAYDSLASGHRDRHLINVCSVQKPSTEMARRYTQNVTSIHPLFGQRTPADKRNSILTSGVPADSEFASNEAEFLELFSKVSTIKRTDPNGVAFTPDSHDQLMAKTHVAAVVAARQMKVFVDRASDVPDEYIPNSFRLMRDFVNTLEDMPHGTMESILANPYF